MTITAATLQARFTEFSSADEDLVDLCIAEAYRQINTTAWGARADDGAKYLAAHLLAVSLRNTAATLGQAFLKGPLLNEKVGPLERSFASLGFASKLEADDMILMQTPYGAQYLSLRKLVFASRDDTAVIV